jgi:hypothetical protein
MFWDETPEVGNSPLCPTVVPKSKTVEIASPDLSFTLESVPSRALGGH